jgi:hypothetical protein
MMEWKGAWSNDIGYQTGAVVTNDGGTYVALQEVAKGSPAPPSAAWGVVAAPPPPTFDWLGPWVATKQYKINDAVSYDEGSAADSASRTEESAFVINSYIAVRVPPVGTKPTDASYWEPMSSNKQIQQQGATIAAYIATSAAIVSAIAAGFTATANWINLKAQAAKAGIDAGKALLDAGKALGDAAKAELEAGKATKEAAQAKKDAGDALLKAEKALLDVNKAIEDATDALRDAKSAVKEAKRAQNEAKRAQNLGDDIINREDQQIWQDKIGYGSANDSNII